LKAHPSFRRRLLIFRGSIEAFVKTDG
jgi:hypothetical protein